MQFHIEFTYRAEDRDKIVRYLNGGGLDMNAPVKFIGTWVAMQTGIAYGLVEATQPKALLQFCAGWADFGTLKVTPVIGLESL